VKEIVIVGNEDEKNTLLETLTKSPKYKVKKAKSWKEAQRLIKKLNPDFVLCLGKIDKNAEGKYFLEI
jgi:DNA-binding response OmpR family regulator